MHTPVNPYTVSNAPRRQIRSEQQQTLDECCRWRLHILRDRSIYSKSFILQSSKHTTHSLFTRPQTTLRTMASNTPNTGAPLSPAEVRDRLAILFNDLETCMIDNSKLSKKLEDGLMEQKCSERMLERKLEGTRKDLLAQERHSEANIIMQEIRLDASISRVTKLEKEIAELKKGMSGTCIELLEKIGQLKGRILGMEEARHVEKHEQPSNATDNVVVKVCSPLSLTLLSVIRRHCDDNSEQPYFISAPRYLERLWTCATT